MTLSRRRFLQTGIGAAAAALAETNGLAAAARRLAARGTVRFGVVGAGDAGRRRASSLAALPGCELAVLCDVAGEALEEAVADLRRRRLAVPDLCADLGDLLRHPRLDAVVIAAPDRFHAAMAEAACRAGKHVFVERPLALEAEACDRVLGAARLHDTQVVVAASPFARQAERWRRFLSSGRIGQVQALRIRYAPPRAWLSAMAGTGSAGAASASLAAGAADLIEHVRAALGLGYPARICRRPDGAGGGGPSLLYEFPSSGQRPLAVEIAIAAAVAEHRGAAEITWRASAGELREAVTCGNADTGGTGGDAACAGNARGPASDGRGAAWTTDLAVFAARIAGRGRSPRGDFLASHRSAAVLASLTAVALTTRRPVRADPQTGDLRC